MDLLKEELRASFIKEKRFLDTHTRIENLEIEIGICRRETIFFLISKKLHLKKVQGIL